MEKFKLEIKNMIDPNFRHHMEKFIEDYGFKLIGGGCNLNNKTMDISFENPEVNHDNIKPAVIPKRTTDG